MIAVRWIVNAVMLFPGNIATALLQIWANKVRSLLTVLGIIIAVTSIIVVVSLVQGFGDYVTNFLRGLGTNMMVCYPSGFEVRAASTSGRRRCPSRTFGPWIRMPTASADIAGCLSTATIEYGRRQLTGIGLRGTNEFFQPIRNFYVDAGRFYSVVDVDSAAPVCVLGREVLRKLECDESLVGDYVVIDGQRFQVIGLLEAKGSFMGDNQDELICIPWTTAMKMYPERRDYLAFYVEAAGEDRRSPARKGSWCAILRQRHGSSPVRPTISAYSSRIRFSRSSIGCG
jgi:putative ABC transport system permease protein